MSLGKACFTHNHSRSVQVKLKLHSGLEQNMVKILTCLYAEKKWFFILPENIAYMQMSNLVKW